MLKRPSAGALHSRTCKNMPPAVDFLQKRCRKDRSEGGVHDDNSASDRAAFVLFFAAVLVVTARVAVNGRDPARSNNARLAHPRRARPLERLNPTVQLPPRLPVGPLAIAAVRTAQGKNAGAPAR